MPAADPSILLVDDHPVLRPLLLRTLQVLGYRDCQSVGSAREAIALLERCPVDLLIVDVTLDADDLFPNGCAAAAYIVRRWPGTRVLFISGYHEQELVATGKCPEGIPLAHKPMAVATLAARIVETLSLPPWQPPVADHP